MCALNKNARGYTKQPHNCMLDLVGLFSWGEFDIFTPSKTFALLLWKWMWLKQYKNNNNLTLNILLECWPLLNTPLIIQYIHNLGYYHRPRVSLGRLVPHRIVINIVSIYIKKLTSYILTMTFACGSMLVPIHTGQHPIVITWSELHNGVGHSTSFLLQAHCPP